MQIFNQCVRPTTCGTNRPPVSKPKGTTRSRDNANLEESPMHKVSNETILTESLVTHIDLKMSTFDLDWS